MISSYFKMIFRTNEPYMKQYAVKGLENPQALIYLTFNYMNSVFRQF